MTDTNLFNTLKERGLLYQCSDEETLKKRLSSGEPLVVYEGSDPTANSLHIGHCVPYCVLRRFQKAGHKVIVLMGGATACIGDPSGKTEMRKMLSAEEINSNIESIKKSLDLLKTEYSDDASIEELAKEYEWLKNHGMGEKNYITEVSEDDYSTRVDQIEEIKMLKEVYEHK